jgi:hypothetical protein
MARIAPDPRAVIKRLTAEIDRENRILHRLMERHRHDPATLATLLEFCDPPAVVPQVCKRQLVVYLAARLEGSSEIESLHLVLSSRYDANPLNPLRVRASDFEGFLRSGKVGLPEVCKEILYTENPHTDRSLLDSLVDQYFRHER